MKKKLIKIFAAFLVAIITFTTFTTNVNAAAAKTLKLGAAENVPAYVAGTYFTTKTTKAGKYVYCLNIHKDTAQNVTANLVKARDAGFAYIIKNGYPNKSFTGERLKDYYITQTAVWWYLDDTTGSSNLTKSFKTTGSDPHNLRPHIKKLVKGAKEAKEKGYAKTSISASVSNKNMTLSSDEKYYVSKAITVNSSNLDTYKVAVKSGPEGTAIIDTDGNKQTKFKASKKFKVRIPASKVTKSTKVKVTISGTGTVDKAYEYAPENTSMQHVIPAYLSSESKDVDTTITLNVTPKEKETPPVVEAPPVEEVHSQVTIIKVDKSTETALAGAKLVLKDASGNVIDSWTTTTSGYVIKDLADGTYSVVETEAPENYKLNTEPVTFTITESNRSQTIKFYNELEENLISIIKLDKKTENPVAGAVLVLKDEKGNEITSWTSTLQSHIIKNLPNGTYIVSEKEAPKGYKLSEEEVKFTVTDSARNHTVKFYNEAKDRIVNITKIDKSTGLPLAGAEIVVKDSEGNEVVRFTSTTDPYIITDIADGTYTVEEVSAPAGYMRTEEVFTFTIDNDHLSHQITIENYPEVDVPDTASNSSLFLTILGLVVIGLGIGFVKKHEQKVK